MWRRGKMPSDANIRLGWGMETFYVTEEQKQRLRGLSLIEWCDLCHEWHPTQDDGGQRLPAWAAVKKELGL